MDKLDDDIIDLDIDDGLYKTIYRLIISSFDADDNSTGLVEEVACYTTSEDNYFEEAERCIKNFDLDSYLSSTIIPAETTYLKLEIVPVIICEDFEEIEDTIFTDIYILKR